MIAAALKPRLMMAVSMIASCHGATAGIHLKFKEKINKSIIPSQKFGIETPVTASVIVKLSIQVPLLMAAMIPKISPTISETPKLASAKSIE